MTTRDEDDSLSSRAALGATAALYLGDHDPLDPLASPLYGERTALPPVRVHVGESEVLLDDSVRYGERLEQAGGSDEVHVWHGMIHFVPSKLALLRASREALDDIASFLRSHLAIQEEPG